MLLDRPRRRRELLGLGIGLILVFVALRYSNLYGDKVVVPPAHDASKSPSADLHEAENPPQQIGKPGPWSVFDDWWRTVFSFVNCQKYPPSLVFLLMTLGPAIVLLGLFDRDLGLLSRFFVVYGRVPLFFYLLHWFLIKGIAIDLAHRRYGRADWMYGDVKPGSAPKDYGYDLGVVYLIWLSVVFVLFPICYWYAGVKKRSRSAWLSYL